MKVGLSKTSFKINSIYLSHSKYSFSKTPDYKNFYKGSEFEKLQQKVKGEYKEPVLEEIDFEEKDKKDLGTYLNPFPQSKEYMRIMNKWYKNFLNHKKLKDNNKKNFAKFVS